MAGIGKVLKGVGQYAQRLGGEIAENATGEQKSWGRKKQKPKFSEKFRVGETTSFKKGGKVRKTGHYKLHKGERVLNKRQTRKFAKRFGRK
jgi:hypothetical protein